MENKKIPGLKTLWFLLQVFAFVMLQLAIMRIVAKYGPYWEWDWFKRAFGN